MNIKEFINSNNLQTIIDELKKDSMIIKKSGDIDISRLKQHLKERQFILYGFNCTLQNENELAEWLKSLIKNREDILRYIRARDKFNNDVKDTEEYPPGEEPDDDDKPVTLEVLGYPETSIVDFIIELDMLINNPKHLADYYKRLKIPGAPKFATDIKRLYKSTFSE